ncbi:MAG: sigma-70 family RNA polymerase sigma factor [Bacteroidetes bacterium]|nr:MAG: sigma-70 family RNA polymerase sigma factor [Bacteroidota bacterium]
MPDLTPEQGERLLIQRISEAGDLHAFRQVVETYSPALVTYARTFLRQPGLAEEAVSEVWIKIWRRRAALGAVQQLQAYLFRAVKHQALNAREQAARHPFVPLEGLPVEPGTHPEGDTSPLSQMEAGELKTLLDSAIAELPAGSQAAFRLVREKGLSYQEAADALGISLNSLKTQLARAMKRLRHTLGQYLASVLLM